MPRLAHLAGAAVSGIQTAETRAGQIGAPGRCAGYRAVIALVRRDLAERRSLRLSVLLDFTFGLLNLVVFLFVSRVLILPANAGFAHSASYFDFVAVGITFMLVVQAASVQLTGRITAEQRSGTLEMLVTQPAPRWALAVGLAGYPFTFGLLRAGAYLAILGTIFGLRVEQADWIGVGCVLLLGAVAMLGVGIGLVAFVIAVGHGDAVARLLVVALSFMSGAYFPVTALPDAVRTLSTALPSRIALDGLRQALTGGGWSSTALTLLIVNVILLPVAILAFNHALGIACNRGNLTRD